MATYQVSADADSGYLTAAVDNDHYYAGHLAGYIDGFARWEGVTIPVGATITSAKVQLYTNFLLNGGCIEGSTMRFEDSINPAAVTSRVDYDGKDKTTENVSWNNIPDDDAWTDSPDISAIIQELVDSYDYSAGAPMQLLHTGNDVGNGATRAYSLSLIHISEPTRPY